MRTLEEPDACRARGSKDPMTGQLNLGCFFLKQNSVSPTEPSCKVAEVGRLWWRAVCGSDLEYGGIVALLGLFIAG